MGTFENISKHSDDFLSDGVLDQFGSSASTHCTSNRRGHGCYRKGTKEAMINPIQSAAIRTRNFSFRYGKFEARVKLPKGDWIWPAIWLLPKQYVYGRWPASGEVDIMESRGNNHLTYNDGTFENQLGNQMVSQSLHWGPNFRSDTFFKTSSTTTKDKGSFSDGFHLYGMDWNRNGINFSVDGKATLNVTLGKGGFWKLGNFKKRFPGLKNPWKMGTQLAPFDEEFYIVMNVAIGGTNNYFNDMFFPKPPWDNDDGTRNGTYNSDSVGFKAMKQFWGAREEWLQTWHGNNVAMKVDYIKVWAHGED